MYQQPQYGQAPIVQPLPASYLDDYRSVRTRALVVLVLFALLVLVKLLVFGSAAMENDLLHKILGGVEIDQQTLKNNDVREALVNGLDGLMYLATSTTFLFWTYRAYRNLMAIAADAPETTAGFAVGSFFIPILNLFRPRKVFQEMWAKSDPDVSFARPVITMPSNSDSSTLINVWWVFWIISNLFGNVGAYGTTHKTARDLIAANNVVLAGTLIVIPAAVLAMAVVWEITKRQEARFAALQASHVPQPGSSPQPGYGASTFPSTYTPLG
ncbi:MAG: DUF4328 domain-containing protein [Blastocatellia bacterium]|nr:DUF4328 domain-containing protein [Blastocatellia bacterium]